MITRQFYKEDRDFGNVYRIMTDRDTGGNLMTRPGHNDLDSFSRWFRGMLDREYENFYVFYSDRNFIGISYIYDFRLVDGHCSLGVAVAPEHCGTGLGSKIAIDTLEETFRSYPLRKVFLRVYGHNAASFASLEDAGLVMEAELKDYHYLDGAYEPLRIYSVTREQFNSMMIVLGRTL